MIDNYKEKIKLLKYMIEIKNRCIKDMTSIPELVKSYRKEIKLLRSIIKDLSKFK